MSFYSITIAQHDGRFYPTVWDGFAFQHLGPVDGFDSEGAARACAEAWINR